MNPPQCYNVFVYSLYSQRRLVKSAVAPAICSNVVPRSSHSTLSAHDKLGLISLIFRSDICSTMSIMYDPRV